MMDRKDENKDLALNEKAAEDLKKDEKNMKNSEFDLSDDNLDKVSGGILSKDVF